MCTHPRGVRGCARPCSMQPHATFVHTSSHTTISLRLLFCTLTCHPRTHKPPHISNTHAGMSGGTDHHATILQHIHIHAYSRAYKSGGVCSWRHRHTCWHVHVHMQIPMAIHARPHSRPGAGAGPAVWQLHSPQVGGWYILAHALASQPCHAHDGLALLQFPLHACVRTRCAPCGVCVCSWISSNSACRYRVKQQARNPTPSPAPIPHPHTMTPRHLHPKPRNDWLGHYPPIPPSLPSPSSPFNSIPHAHTPRTQSSAAPAPAPAEHARAPRTCPNSASARHCARCLWSSSGCTSLLME